MLDSAQVVCRSDKQNLGQVVAHLEKVVVKRVVLLGIQDFKKRTRGVTLNAHAELVDFIEHQHWVGRARLFDLLQNAAWHGSDVGFAVAADFGLVAHSAQRHAHVGASKCLSHRASK